MKGIIVNDFEIAIKRLDKASEELSAKVSDINHDFDELSKSLTTKDLQFLTNKLGLEIAMTKSISNKVLGYHNVLLNVLKAYQAELEELAKNVSIHSQIHYSREEL